MRKLNVVLGPGSDAHRAVEPPEPEEAPPGAAAGGNLAEGFEPQPNWNLRDFNGKTISDLTFVNRYVGGAEAWRPADMESIDNALSAALSDAALQSVMAQYFAGPITSNMLPSAVSALPAPATVYKDIVEQTLARGLYDEGALRGADLANSVLNIVLPEGIILSDEFSPGFAPAAGGQEKLKEFERRRAGTIMVDADNAADSTKGLGGYHGSIHLDQNTTIYYAVGVYSKGNNGIPAFGDAEPWKNVVATFYHELNEARTDADVEDVNAQNNNNLLGWYSEAGQGEIGDLPMNAAGENLGLVFQEVPLAGGGGNVPIQLMWSNAADGPAVRA